MRKHNPDLFRSKFSEVLKNKDQDLIVQKVGLSSRSHFRNILIGRNLPSRTLYRRLVELYPELEGTLNPLVLRDRRIPGTRFVKRGKTKPTQVEMFPNVTTVMPKEKVMTVKNNALSELMDVYSTLPAETAQALTNALQACAKDGLDFDGLAKFLEQASILSMMMNDLVREVKKKDSLPPEATQTEV